jgi:hypothetical protein
MSNMNQRVNLWMLGAIVALMLAPNPLCAQIGAGVDGQPVIATGATTATSDGIFIDAFVATTGTDICNRINKAWTAALGTSAPYPSVVIDARGFTYANAPGGAGSAWNCSVSPFPSNSGTCTCITANGGTLLLGNVRILTWITWQVPSLIHVEGLGVSGLSPTTSSDPGYVANTVIQAQNSTTANPVIQLGNSSSALSFDAHVKGLTVDAFGLAGTGILNESAEEGSTVEDVNIWNATQYGLHVIADNVTGPPSIGAQNSGPYHNINIQYNSNCSSCSPTAAILIEDPNDPDSGKIVRDFDSITVSGAGLPDSVGAVGIRIDGVGTHITNSHIEYFTTGIEIGVNQATNSVEIENVSNGCVVNAACSGNWDVDIGAKSGDVSVIGLTHQFQSPNLLNDQVTGNQIVGTLNSNSGAFLGWYLLGEGKLASAAVLSSAAITNSATTSPGWLAPQSLDIVGKLTKGSGTFKIDHPLDPANMYLYHSFVESPDMMNVYNGSVTTDKRGMALVTLPDYFEALNRDFRYQLTAIGSFAQATVAKEIQDNRFAIRTSRPGVKVSWQVTGIRQDAYANAHRIQVEEQKPPREQGHYLHPELFDNGGKKEIAKEAVGK